MRIVLLFILILSAKTLDAQILKVNKNNLNADSANFWLGAFSFNLDLNNRSVTDDNENAYLGFNLTADVVYVAEKNAYVLINDFEYFRSSDGEGAFVSTGFAHLRANWRRKERLSYENFTQIQYDQGRNMPLRFLVGGDVRYRMIDKDKAKLILGVGAMYEIEHWIDPDDESTLIEKDLPKSSNYLNGYIQFTENIKLDVITYYQVGYDWDDEVFRQRASGDILLSFQFNKRLSFLAKFNAQFENKPIIPINKFIYSFKNGIRFSF